jgi:hypothetical protein
MEYWTDELNQHSITPRHHSQKSSPNAAEWKRRTRSGSGVPDNYSLAAFNEKRLDYGLHLATIELWGNREHVLKAVAVQNEIIRGLAARQDRVLFVDEANLMAGFPRYFNDACHFTAAGSAKFVEHLLSGLLPSLQSR